MRLSASCQVAHRLKEPEGDELGPQRRRIGEMDRVKTESTGGGRVDVDIVDKNGAQRVDREALEQQFKDARIGLDHLDIARDQDAAEPAKEIKTLTRLREALGRPVAERIERHLTIAQLLQDLDGAG